MHWVPRHNILYTLIMKWGTKNYTNWKYKRNQNSNLGLSYDKSIFYLPIPNNRNRPNCTIRELMHFKTVKKTNVNEWRNSVPIKA